MREMQRMKTKEEEWTEQPICVAFLMHGSWKWTSCVTLAQAHIAFVVEHPSC